MPLITREEKGSKLTIQEMDGNLLYLESLGLAGTNYVFVSANGTPTENAAELQAAYDKAATLVNVTSSWVSFGLYGAMSRGGGDYEVYFNPSTDFFKPSTTYSLKINGVEYTGTTAFAYGSSAYFTTNAPDGLTVTSFEALDVIIERATVVAALGYYDFENSPFVMNQEYVDLVSLDGNRSVIFNSSNSSGTISITANDVFVKGVDTQNKNFTIATNLNLLRVENCKGGNNSFGYGDFTFVTSGTFINCEGGNNSFGANGICSGTFIDCIGGDGSFGYFGTVSGTFINCVGGNSSFGGDGGDCLGVFTNCVGGDNSFGYFGTVSGTFSYCIGGEYSFGAQGGTISGNLTNCIGGTGSFGGGGTTTGTFINCRGGEYSFGGDGYAGGFFKDCIGGNSSFGGYGGNGGSAEGTFINCRGLGSSFGGYGGSASGTFINCLGDDYSFGGEGGAASGNFTNCVGGLNSFAGGLGKGGELSGKLYYCRLTTGTFSTVSIGGRTIYCIDGNNNPNNQ